MTDAGANREAVGEIIFDGVRLKTTSDLAQFSNLARFQPKILEGDPTKDDNDLLSSIQNSDYSGGSGVFDRHEGTDTNRVYFSTLNTRFPGYLTRPPFAYPNEAGAIEGSRGDKQVLGEFYGANEGDFYAVWRDADRIMSGLIDGSDVSHMLDGTKTYTYADDLDTAAGRDTRKGVAWQPASALTREYLYIPAGNGGYYWVGDYLDDPNLSFDTTLKFAQFAVWDNKLVGVTTGGRLYYATDDVGTGGLPDWQPYDLTWRLSKSYRVRGLVSYFDRGDRPCLFILTDRDIWQFDPDGPEIFRLEMGWPSHPRHAMAHCVWNNELYISLGMGVFRYEGGTFVPVGLDRDNGLPVHYQGYIVDMWAGYNSLYALVQSNNRDPSQDGGTSSLHEFTTFGWHCLWADYNDELPPFTSPQTAKTVTGGMVTQSNGVYTLLFSTSGSDDHIYTMPLSEELANPRAGIRAGQLFAGDAYYYLEFGKTDNALGGYTKVANAWEIWVDVPTQPTNPTDRDDILLQYKIDTDEDWITLAEFLSADTGKHRAMFGDIIPDTEFTEGCPYESIQRRLVFRTANGVVNIDKPSIVTNSVFSYLKTVSGSFAFQFEIVIKDGSNDGRYNSGELMEWLDSLIEDPRFRVLTVGGKQYRSFLGQEAGKKPTGDISDGLYQLNLIQIREDL